MQGLTRWLQGRGLAAVTIATVGFVLGFLCTAAEAAVRPASIIIDADTGEVLQEANADVLNYPASLTKMMTLYLVFEAKRDGKLKLDQQLTVSTHAASRAPSKLGLMPGETIAVRDAILGLVTKSANDAASTVAEALAGSEDAFAERMTAKASVTALLPDGVDFIAGSTLIHIYLTAYYALVSRAQVRPGETVLVTGAAGGVGLACVELARLLEARVIAAVGSPAKSDAVRERGAHEVIDYSSEDVKERVKALTGGEGIDVCVDNVGGKLFATLARLMRWNGRLLPVGFTSGEVPSIPMNLPLLKNYSIVGMFSGAWTERCPDEVERAMEAIMRWVGEGKLRPRVERVLPLERAAEAMSAIADRSVIGRTVLSVR